MAGHQERLPRYLGNSQCRNYSRGFFDRTSQVGAIDFATFISGSAILGIRTKTAPRWAGEEARVDIVQRRMPQPKGVTQ